MPLCEFQPIVGQSPSEVGEFGKQLRLRCIHCGYVTEPTLYRDMERDCTHPHSGRSVVQPPNILHQYANFTIDLARHISAGAPASTREEILEAFRVCSRCPRYSDLTGQCGECGCYVNVALHCENLNMLAWAEKQCPNGYWVSALRRRAGEPLVPLSPGKPEGDTPIGEGAFEGKSPLN